MVMKAKKKANPAKDKVRLTLLSGEDCRDPDKVVAFYEQTTGKQLTQAERDEVKQMLKAG